VIEAEAVDAARRPVVEDAEEVLAIARVLPLVRAVLLVVEEELHVVPVVREVVAEVCRRVHVIGAGVEARHLLLEVRVAGELRPLERQRETVRREGADEGVAAEVRALRGQAREEVLVLVAAVDEPIERLGGVEDCGVKEGLVVRLTVAPQRGEILAARDAIAVERDVLEIVRKVVVTEVIERDVEQDLRSLGMRGGDEAIELGVRPARRVGVLVATIGDARAGERAARVEVVAHGIGRAEVVAGVGDAPAIVVGEQGHEPQRVRPDLLLHVTDGDALAEVGGVLGHVVERAELHLVELAADPAGHSLGAIDGRRRDLLRACRLLLGRAEIGAAGIGGSDLRLVEDEAPGGQVDWAVVRRVELGRRRRRVVGRARAAGRGERRHQEESDRTNAAQQGHDAYTVVEYPPCATCLELHAKQVG
jgi:hypothetical protein